MSDETDSSERDTLPPRLSTDPPEAAGDINDIMAHAPPWAAALYRQNERLAHDVAGIIHQRDQVLIEVLTAHTERFDAMLTGIETQLTELRGDMAIIRHEVQNTRQDIARHSMTIMRLDERVRRLEDGLKSTEHTMTTLDLRDRNFGEQLREMQEQLNSLQEQLGQIKPQIEELRSVVVGRADAGQTEISNRRGS